MRFNILAFSAGILFVQLQPALPDWGWALAAGLLCLFLRFLPQPDRLRCGLAVIVCLALGVAWAAWRAEIRLADELPLALEGQDLQLTGVVAALPQPFAQGSRFEFVINSALTADGKAASVPSRVMLSWYAGRRDDAVGVVPTLRPGEVWQLTARLRRPHGNANPGGFDYEAWLLARGIRATGYVRHGATRLDGPPASVMQRVHRLRTLLRDRMLAELGDADQGGLLVALAVGDQDGISASTWEVFRRTGVGHLVSISGLHIALVGLFCGGAVAMLWRRLPVLALRVPAQKAGALAALGGASAYALLAGLGIPVLRAWLMLVVAAAVLFSGRAVAPSRVLAIALLVVLVADPWAVLSAGFWLSFGAVAIILASVGGRIRARTGWRGAVRVQLAISVALVPLLVAQFQSFPLLSPLANVVAIPLVSFVITPLVLLSLPWPTALLLAPAEFAARLMMDFLHWLAAWELALWEQAPPPPWLLACGLVAVAVLLLPRATPGRLAAPAVLGALLAWQPARPLEGGFEVQVLDIGQGLAVHVRTRSHDLLFDAGPPYGSAADAGSRVILPYLRAAGTRSLDRLVLSHGDADHVGGAASVIGGMPVGEVLAGQPASALEIAVAGAAGGRAPALRGCAQTPPWTWDGVRFEILHPLAEQSAGRRHDNDASCVLRVAGPAGAVLLTGDIGTAAEAALLARATTDTLRSEVVVSAHHGSRSSSSPAFVDATLPAHVVHSAGHRNAFGHPHPQVWARWAAAGARNWRTDAQGAIGMVFAADADDGVDEQHVGEELVVHFRNFSL